MYHSVIISGKNTYDEWGLIPTERPIVSPPSVKTNYVELPGSSESIDYSDILNGRVAYGQRTGSWTFYFDSEWPGGKTSELLNKKMNGKLWMYVYTSLINYVHGQRHNIVLEDEPNKTYVSRLTLSDWSSNGKFSQITINYSIDPPARI